jgi:hypothetical protein
MRAVTASLLAASAILTGCAAHNKVAAVTDARGGHPKVQGAIGHLVRLDELAADDRLVLLRVEYENPLKYKHYITVGETAAASGGAGARDLQVDLDGGSGGGLLLLRFPAGGDTATVQHYACMSTLILGIPPQYRCSTFPVPSGSHLQARLPRPGEVAYLGHVRFRVEDIFPHRGTQNGPRMKELVVRDAFDADLAAARERWPGLAGRTITKELAEVRQGRAPGTLPF